MKKSILILVVILLLVHTIVFAEPDNSHDSGCSLLSPLNCMGDLVKEALKSVAFLFSSVTGVIALPFLLLLKKIMVEPPITHIFLPVWSAIVVVILLNCILLLFL